MCFRIYYVNGGKRDAANIIGLIVSITTVLFACGYDDSGQSVSGLS